MCQKLSNKDKVAEVCLKAILLNVTAFLFGIFFYDVEKSHKRSSATKAAFVILVSFAKTQNEANSEMFDVGCVWVGLGEKNTFLPEYCSFL